MYIYTHICVYTQNLFTYMCVYTQNKVTSCTPRLYHTYISYSPQYIYIHIYVCIYTCTFTHIFVSIPKTKSCRALHVVSIQHLPHRVCLICSRARVLFTNTQTHETYSEQSEMKATFDPRARAIHKHTNS